MGGIFAIFAAICNSTIGIFSKLSFDTNADLSTVAFLRCFFAFIFVNIALLIKKDGFKQVASTKPLAKKTFLTSFFGVFVLYYFEIWALSYTKVSIVSFLLYASGILAVILGVLYLNESLDIYKVISLILVLAGIVFIFSSLFDGNLNLQGGILAVIAGCGYSAFLVFTRKFEIPANFGTLWWLFGFGSLFLFIPFVINGSSLPKLSAYPYIISLSLIPTVGGYYFTNKALSMSEVSRVQIFEMSEPIFASIFAYVLFGELMGTTGIVGGLLITLGLVILQRNFTFLNNFLNLFKKTKYINKE